MADIRKKTKLVALLKKLGDDSYPEGVVLGDLIKELEKVKESLPEPYDDAPLQEKIYYLEGRISRLTDSLKVIHDGVMNLETAFLERVEEDGKNLKANIEQSLEEILAELEEVRFNALNRGGGSAPLQISNNGTHANAKYADINFKPGTGVTFSVSNNETTKKTDFTINSSGGVTSVSNSDSTLTISPTTGDVVASLNLANSNTWTAGQTITMATTTNHMLTLKTTDNGLTGRAIRILNSSDVTQFILRTDGKCFFGDGTAAAPSFSFVNANTTGMYYTSASSLLGFSNAGSSKLEITPTTTTFKTAAVFEGNATFAGGAVASSYLSGTWINLPTTGPSAIGVGGAGSVVFVGYVASGDQYFDGSLAGDMVIRNVNTKSIHLGLATSGGVPALLRLQKYTFTAPDTVTTYDQYRLGVNNGGTLTTTVDIKITDASNLSILGVYTGNDVESFNRETPFRIFKKCYASEHDVSFTINILEDLDAGLETRDEVVNLRSYNESTMASANLTITAKNVGIDTALSASPTARLHLPAGTTAAGTAPFKFTSGTNLTTAEAGAMEYDGTQLYFSPSTTRNALIQDNGTRLQSGRIPFATTNGYLIDDSDFTFATDTLTVTKIAATTFTGNITISTKDIVTDTTTGSKIATVGGSSGQKLGFFGATPIVQPVLATGAGATVDNVITALQNLGLVRQS